ncbi:uracil-DNA glycosylase [Sodiomyces alkalinus F11]|uniref:Uracil-DNA glycosylase n=1 Tax=Sodiomyces alkalinus (strain CBS 110278 / VKM F-3762 / F11) TaxID=1314773 RepID=A0A3N2Q6E5_SODAK|nr:uracil-DNA glycosylase [Sodiomyces alkalinus F11]ROT42322.1 uracil-DNA glycosylase [Sodiomyces alkalinus F11]
MSTLKRKASNDQASDSKKPKQNGSIMSFFGKTETAKDSGASGTPAPGFDKAKWVAGLTEEQRKLLQLEIDTLHESWLALLKDDIATKEFLDLKRFLHRETDTGRKWFPPKEDVYSWSRHCPFNKVKVVILGQDPYHNDNQAHGLAFSVRPPTPAPPSLRNIYIALKKDYPTFTPPPNKQGLLTPWADRGVLLLNTCLTVRAHEAYSHSNRGWERFTQRVIDLVAARRPKGVVFVAWGSPAARRVAKIDQTRHLVLKSVHPSPLSAMRGFFDCGHFRKANEWLIQRHGADAEIDWDLGGGNVSTLTSKKAEVKTETTKTVVEKGIENKENLKEEEEEEGEEGAGGATKIGVQAETEEVKVTA